MPLGHGLQIPDSSLSSSSEHAHQRGAYGVIYNSRRRRTALIQEVRYKTRTATEEGGDEDEANHSSASGGWAGKAALPEPGPKAHSGPAAPPRRRSAAGGSRADCLPPGPASRPLPARPARRRMRRGRRGMAGDGGGGPGAAAVPAAAGAGAPRVPPAGEGSGRGAASEGRGGRRGAARGAALPAPGTARPARDGGTAPGLPRAARGGAGVLGPCPRVAPCVAASGAFARGRLRLLQRRCGFGFFLVLQPPPWFEGKAFLAALLRPVGQGAAARQPILWSM